MTAPGLPELRDGTKEHADHCPFCREGCAAIIPDESLEERGVFVYVSANSLNEARVKALRLMDVLDAGYRAPDLVAALEEILDLTCNDHDEALKLAEAALARAGVRG